MKRAGFRRGEAVKKVKQDIAAAQRVCEGAVVLHGAVVDERGESAVKRRER